jgi:hypothetical protein
VYYAVPVATHIVVIVACNGYIDSILLAQRLNVVLDVRCVIVPSSG